MPNVVRCPQCRKEIIDEEKRAHQCYGIVKEIPISFFYTTVKDDTKTIICKGLDGILYRLVQKSDENLQR